MERAAGAAIEMIDDCERVIGFLHPRVEETYRMLDNEKKIISSCTSRWFISPSGNALKTFQTILRGTS